MPTIQTLPRIVRFGDTVDAGEGATCPHCGAVGRYILHFTLEGGGKGAAMRGCAKLFPVSRVAEEELRLRTKLAEYVKKGWKSLNKRDSEALEVIERYYSGSVNETFTLSVVEGAKKANQAKFRR